MDNNIYNYNSEEKLLEYVKRFENKRLKDIEKEIIYDDDKPRRIIKGNIGYIIENGIFNIKKNSLSSPDIFELGIEIKTCPLKYNKNNKLTVKEPLSLNIINYNEDYKKDILESSLYKKNKKILFFCYIYDKSKNLSEYLIKYIFLWQMDSKVIEEITPDYNKIIEKIKSGNAHNIHQNEHKYLTICPKHSGKFKDPNCNKSKCNQPFSNSKAEVRAFRFKNKYMNIIITRALNKKLEKGGWID